MQCPEIDSSSDEGIIPDQFDSTIEFKNVCFSYPTRPDVQASSSTLPLTCMHLHQFLVRVYVCTYHNASHLCGKDIDAVFVEYCTSSKPPHPPNLAAYFSQQLPINSTLKIHCMMKGSMTVYACACVLCMYVCICMSSLLKLRCAYISADTALETYIAGLCSNLAALE